MSDPTAYCAACGKEMLPKALYCAYCGAAEPERKTVPPPPASFHVAEIQRVGVWSLVKFAFMIHAVIGLVFGILFAAVGAAGLSLLPESRLLLFGSIPWIGALVLIPMLYGLIGAFLGFCAASTYNLFAWGIGGIRVTLKES
ncbi:MAG: zinc ribbon domain-containing protein [Deltaproteobacteria bacterium]|nr:zinc ribbon domain-containing protein [Deltaproteobacteria bacterium]